MVDCDDFENSDTQAMVKVAIENPTKYVLKPMKEGGGNNIFGDKLRTILQSGKPKESYFLMEIINAPVLKTLMIRKGELKFEDSINELGFFSLVIANSHTGEIYLNRVDGLLPRTKTANSNEGGVNAGFAVVDHPVIVSEKDPKNLKPTFAL